LVTCHIFTVFLFSLVYDSLLASLFLTLFSYTYFKHLALDQRTRWGDRVLRALGKNDSSFEPVPRFALYGESMLSGGVLDDLKQMYKAQEETDTGGCGCGC
ncbi:MAG: hypothetical protein AAFO95_20745, partial [Cyanobacteria bacterium J06600_6]